MLVSMTGFGRCAKAVGGRQLSAEIKTVNHRYFECSVRLPRSFTFLEERIKSEVAKHVFRGKVDVSIFSQSIDVVDSVVEPNVPVISSYLSAFDTLCKQFDLQNDVKASTFTSFPEAFKVVKMEIDEDGLFADIMQVLTPALEELTRMRQLEGEKLQVDMLSRLKGISGCAAEIEHSSKDREREYFEKLHSRLKALLADTSVDEARLLTEAAIFADKTAVSEETVRIDSHIKQFFAITNESVPTGRKLDFLIQELNREVNTIGSKIADNDVTLTVVEMKAQLEKVREQVQNIE